MSDYATFISNYFYGPSYHPVANRFFQIGYSTGCTQTLAVRELAAEASWAYGAGRAWNQSRPSYVARNPAAFVLAPSFNLSSLGANQTLPIDPVPPWIPSNMNGPLNNALTQDCQQAGQNCNITTDPRLNISDGWVRWFTDSLNNFNGQIDFGQHFANNIYGVLASALAAQQTTAHIKALQSDGAALLQTISTLKSLVSQLDAALTSPANMITPYRGPLKVSLDTYLRTVFEQQCLCTNSAMQAPIYTGGATALMYYGIVCPPKVATYMLPSGWTSGGICEYPASFVLTALKSAANGNPLSILQQIQAMEDVQPPAGQPQVVSNLGTLSKQLIQVGLDLQPFEKTCVNNTACQGQSF
jgi:hypothetical protein